MSDEKDINTQLVETLKQINDAINVLYKDIDERLKLIESRLQSQEWKNTTPVYGPIPVMCEQQPLADAWRTTWQFQEPCEPVGDE